LRLRRDVAVVDRRHGRLRASVRGGRVRAPGAAARSRVVDALERPATPRTDRYRRPYEGTDNAAAAMQAYLDWEFGLVEQLGRDGTHHFKVI
ncbi:hypothetical protein PPH41_42340, partial [Burkholderia gladioli]|nr:hypothetical protein [Burkholderia gladioli]